MENGLMTMNNGGMQVKSCDPAAFAAAESAKQRIQAAYIMAYQKPRNIEQCRINILAHCKRQGFAEKVEYSKPIGNTKITGPSIRFAECALREWGNILSDAQVVYEDDKIRRVKIFITDLETNTGFNKEIQISKTVERKSKKDREVITERTNSFGDTVYVVKATDDELSIKEASAISKAIRNEGLRIIPSDIVEEAMETAKETLKKGDSKDPDAAKRKVLDAFASLGILPKELERYLKHSVSSISPAEVADLRKVYTSISSGDCKWNDYINPPIDADMEGGNAPSEPKSLFEKGNKATSEPSLTLGDK